MIIPGSVPFDETLLISMVDLAIDGLSQQPRLAHVEEDDDEEEETKVRLIMVAGMALKRSHEL